MMPRRISRVPPRKVQDGACNTASAQRRLEPVAIGLAGTPPGQGARPLRDAALVGAAQILDQRGFEVRGFAGLQHAGDRQRHLPQRPQIRADAAERLGQRRVRIVPGALDKPDQDLMRRQKPLRAAALEGEFARNLMPAVALAPDQPLARHEDAVENDLVEIVLAGEVADRPDRHPRRHSDRRSAASARHGGFSGRAYRCAPE